MLAAQVSNWEEGPRAIDIPKPETPADDANTIQLKVVAVGIHHLVRSQASGRHYTSGTLPHTPGVDGVGQTPDGKLYYFVSLGITGAMAEYINLPKRNIKPLPSGADPVQIAGLMNPGMASWMAMQARTSNLPEHFTALVLGATSLSGRAAVHLARSLGAERVIGAARGDMSQLHLDGTITLSESTDFSSLGDVDVVLDFVYGSAALQFFTTVRSQRPVQYVQIGSMGGPEISLPSAVVRSKDITIRGAGPGSWKMMQFSAEVEGLLAAVAELPPVSFTTGKLADVEAAWKDEKARTVITM